MYHAHSMLARFTPHFLLLYLLLCSLTPNSTSYQAPHPNFATVSPALPSISQRDTPTNSSSSSSSSSSSPVTVSLSGGLLHTSGFFFNAKVGNQHLTLQVDTSYSSLIVPKKGCVGCRIGDNRYDPTASKASPIACSDPVCAPQSMTCPRDVCFSCSANGHCCTTDTDHCAFNMFYGDGSSGNGTMYSDVLEIGTLKAPVLFGAMHQESYNFELPYADGVFGLAFEEGACHPACIPPVMDALVNKTGIANVFTMCVSRFGGTLVFGAADQSLATRPYQYVALDPVAADNRYIIPAQSEWKVGERTVSVPGITAAMWSVGTTNIGVAKSTFLALVSHLSEHYCHIDGLCSVTSWFRPQRCFPLLDEVVAQMPNITMGLSRGISITLTPDDYLIRYREMHGNMTRCVAFLATDGLAEKGIGLLLGATVMRRYAVVFDRSKKRVGLAPAQHEKCGPTEGSLAGMPGGEPDPDNPVLTADSPSVPGSETVSDDTDIGKRLLEAERCRAETTCSGCSKLKDCAYGYRTGRCVVVEEAGNRPYPWCTGLTCACIATGASGWYVGVGIGVMLVGSIAGLAGLLLRKRQRRQQYEMVQQYEEQDLETF